MQKYEDYFKKLQFRLIGADRNNGCYRFVVEPEGRLNAMTYNELKELCTYIQGICVDVSMVGHATYTWSVFYTTVSGS
ncbi:hypothetical protein [[Clostridium] symbiosum]|uniref:hypothetical protein n=1 Tax=Clostridium symbiosum TaxID=1512 RepID=UPI0034A203BC